MTGKGFLIADDFGLGRGHDAVILRLLSEGRLAGTSVMIDGNLAPSDLSELRELRRQGRQVGLHLNLTQNFTAVGTAPTIGKLMKQAMTGRLPPDLGDALHRQAARFSEMFGGPPDFYDGHQHCHCLPGLEGRVADLPRDACTWLRVPTPRTAGLARNVRTGGTKALIVAAMGWSACQTWRSAGWPVNADFSGFLDLSRPDRVQRDLPALIAADRKSVV